MVRLGWNIHFDTHTHIYPYSCNFIDLSYIMAKTKRCTHTYISLNTIVTRFRREKMTHELETVF